MTEPFRVRVRFSGRLAVQLTGSVIMLAVSIGFVAGAVTGEMGLGAVAFLVLGVIGTALFGTGLVQALGVLFGRRPVLELDNEGVRRPARWPRSRTADTLLPWPEVAAVCVMTRGVPTGRRGAVDYLVFLPTDELAERVSASSQAELVWLVLPELREAVQATPWFFQADAGWHPSFKDTLAELRRREVRLIDRRKR